MSTSLKKLNLCLSVLAIIGLAACGGSSNTSQERPEISTLSSQPDVVSGGDVLVKVTVPRGLNANQVRVLAGGKDVTSSFKPSPGTDALIGRVSGLPEGSTTLEASTVNVSGAVIGLESLAVVNHARTGPVLSGPQETPFVCTVATIGLGEPLDANCSAAREVSYRYWSTSSGFKNFDPSGQLPIDLATTQTSEGKTVNFIVRYERGTINRAVYEIAFLHQPGTALPDPWTTTEGWNRRLRYNFGGGCGGGHSQGSLELKFGPLVFPLATALDQPALARGYAVATSTLNVALTNCSTVLSAETMSMVKEHFIENFGAPVWTVGRGGSGGAVQQFEIAQSYPGLLDGLMPGVSFPSMIEAHTILSDCKLLRTYMTSSAKLPWTDEQKRAVSGYATWQTCDSVGAPGGLGATMVEASACPSLLGASAFDLVSNPAGVRCSLIDTFANVYGRDPITQAVRRPLDNVGVQYGLVAMKAGSISVDQFLELNEKLGGFDANGSVQAARHAADPEALRIAYETGRVQLGTNLDAIPIISDRNYNDTSGDLHDRTRDFQVRAKLDDLFGHHDNHVLLIAPGGTAAAGSAAMLSTQTIEMEKWLDAVSSDQTSDSRAQKVRRNKPVTAKDSCWLLNDSKVEEPANFSSTGACNTLYKPFLDPRSAAGAPLAETALKCQLKPIDVNEYGVTFTSPQITRLIAIFSNGVCDYSKPGVRQQTPSRIWAKF